MYVSTLTVSSPTPEKCLCKPEVFVQTQICLCMSVCACVRACVDVWLYTCLHVCVQGGYKGHRVISTPTPPTSWSLQL